MHAMNTCRPSIVCTMCIIIPSIVIHLHLCALCSNQMHPKLCMKQIKQLSHIRVFDFNLTPLKCNR